jgi:tape measure domain-containing protein
MAENRANLKTVISADSTQFNSALGRATLRAQKAGMGIAKGVGRATSAMASLATRATMAGSAIAGAAAATALFKGSKLAASMESAAVAFASLTGSADTAKKVLEELRVLGAETPFEFPELADAGRKLIAFGEAADTVAETLRRVGDVSSSIGAPISEIAEIYGKARVQGRLFGEDINQLTGRGIPIIGALADQFGVMDEEVKDLVTDGKVGFKELEAAFVTMTSKGGFAFDAMAMQSKTFNGQLSNLSDAVGNLLTRFSAPINSSILPYLEKATEVINALVPKAEEVANRFISGFSPSKMVPLFSAIGSLLVVAVGEGIGKGLQIAGALLTAAFSKEGLSFIGDTLMDIFIDAFNALAPAILELGKSISKALSGEVDMKDTTRVIGTKKPEEERAKTFAEKLEEEMGKIDLAPSDRMKEAAGAFADQVGALFPKVISKATQGSEADLYDKELAEQRARIAADAGPEILGPKKSLQNTQFGPPKSAVADQMGPGKSLMNEGYSDMFARQKSSSSAGFGGLAGLYGMQMKRISGGKVGADSVFNKDRERLGVGSGLVTGGLGEKRRLNTSKDDKDAKKAEELQKTSNDYLDEISKGIKGALSVN